VDAAPQQAAALAPGGLAPLARVRALLCFNSRPKNNVVWSMYWVGVCAVGASWAAVAFSFYFLGLLAMCIALGALAFIW
jgi:hypothetical protein